MSTASRRKHKDRARSTDMTLQKSPDVSSQKASDTCKIDPWLLYDDWLTLSGYIDGSQTEGSSRTLTADGKLVRDMHAVLSRALGARASLIEVRLLQDDGPFEVSRSPSRERLRLLIGFLLNPEHIDRTVDRGPSASDNEASTAFRDFWGARSELRRFQDGSILESVVWQEAADGGEVHRQIVSHVCTAHIGLDVQAWGTGSLGIRALPLRYAHDVLARFDDCWSQYESLNVVIRDLNALPLRMRQLPRTYMRLLNTPGSSSLDRIELSLQFEGSANWPEDLQAVQFAKLALLSKLGEQLDVARSGCRHRIGIDQSESMLTNLAFLDVDLPKKEVTIRIRIVHEREIDLLISRMHAARSIGEREAITDAIASYKRSFVHGPAHLQALRRLALRMPLLLPSIMLFKKWCASHLLTAHLSQQTMELLVLQTFTAPHSYAVPSSCITALLRVLSFLAKWDWRTEPLIIDFSGEITSSQISDATRNFEAWRKRDPHFNKLSAFIASDLDPEGSAWTTRGPSSPVFARICALAKASLAKADGISISLASVFATGFADFDFVLRLKESTVTAQTSVGYSLYKNLPVPLSSQANAFSRSTAISTFIREISRLYADVLVFFHDCGERPIVAALWIPHHKPRAWKTGLNHSTRPDVEGEGQVASNRPAILNDILRIGSGIIEKIEMNRE